jgi:uncharacterized membrane protein (DUF106 family)
MSFIVILTAALKAIPEITGAIRDLRTDIHRIGDSIDEKSLAEYKEKTSEITEKMKHAKSKADMAILVEQLNNI